MLESERVDDAKEFLSELNVRQSERILLVNSHNAAIDAVLNQKGYIGKKQGIDMRFRVNDLSALRLPRVDVTIVLGNLIDNAMEACAGLSDQNRWVSIQILYSENMLSILIINLSIPVISFRSMTVIFLQPSKIPCFMASALGTSKTF